MLIRKSFLLLAFAALGLGLTVDKAWALGGSTTFWPIKSNTSHHGVTVELGVPANPPVFDAQWEALWDGDPTHLATLIFESKDGETVPGKVIVEGTGGALTAAINAKFKIEFEFSVFVDSIDFNNGHGDNCDKFDVTNPGDSTGAKGGGGNKGQCLTTVTCTNETDDNGDPTGFSTLSWTPFAHALTAVSGYVEIQAPFPAILVSGGYCTGSTCTLSLGGPWPTVTTKKGTFIDYDTLKLLFPGGVVGGEAFKELQLALLELRYAGSCVDAVTPPNGLGQATSAASVQCFSDTVDVSDDPFDGVNRGCVIVADHLHVGDAVAAAFEGAPLTNIDYKPESQNLACDPSGETDSGVSTLTICPSPGVDPSALVDVTVENVTPHEATFDGTCAQYKFYTCKAGAEQGTSEAIVANNPGLVNNQVIDVTVRARSGSGNVWHEGTDDVKVVSVP